MSLHRNDHLVSIHQAEMHRHAAEARLAKTARASTGASVSASVADRRKGGVIGRAFGAVVATIRPVRLAAASVVQAQAQAPTSTLTSSSRS
jgi:hypothetical protein